MDCCSQNLLCTTLPGGIGILISAANRIRNISFSDTGHDLMNPPEKRKPRIKFGHIFLVAAALLVLVHFIIAGFGPYFMVLMPAFPFLLLSVLPVSWRLVGQADNHGLIGAGIGALVSVLPATSLFAYDMITGWKGGADIGLGLLYLFLPVYSVIFMGLGYFIGEVIILKRHRDIRRFSAIFQTIALFIGIGLCFYFLLESQSEYDLWRYYQKTDPSAAEIYEIGFWLSILKAGASLLIPLAVYLITRKNKKKASNSLG